MDLTRAAWRKATKSQGNGQCVEVADLGEAVAIRHSNDPNGPSLIFTPGEWDAFVHGAKAGEFDRNR